LNHSVKNEQILIILAPILVIFGIQKPEQIDASDYAFVHHI